MDGGAARSDIAVVEARKFLSAEIEGMSKLVNRSMLTQRFEDRVKQKNIGVINGGNAPGKNLQQQARD